MSKRMQRIGAIVGLGWLAVSCDSGHPSAGEEEPQSCPPSEVDCGDGCVSLFGNASHCGACGRACLAGQICASMTCVCPGGGRLCDARCVDTMHDSSNCGGCGKVCPDGHACVDGWCGWWSGSSGGTAAGGAPTGNAGTNSPDGGSAGNRTSGGALGLSQAGAAQGGAPGLSQGGAAWGGAGRSSAGGFGSDSNDTRSPGCDTVNPPDSGHHTLDVAGTPREYVLEVPQSYDPGRPYPLVVAWHWAGAVASDVANGDGATSPGPYYGLEPLAAGNAIFVAPEGIDYGWVNLQGRDVAFARDLVELLKRDLCIDPERVFSTGFGDGGGMSSATGCAMADVFRAVASISGSPWSTCDSGTEPVAWWGAHGTLDDEVPIQAAREVRDQFLLRNGCTSSAAATEPSPCVAYDDCSAGRPVVWCEWDGGHAVPDFAPEGIWSFFDSFR